MQRLTLLLIMALCLTMSASTVCGQDESEDEKRARSYESAARDVQARLEQSIAELAELRQRIADEMLPLSQQLREYENESLDVEQAYRETTRKLDRNLIDVNTLRGNVEKLEADANYLSNLLGEYVLKFEAGLPIAELQRYDTLLSAARLAPESTTMSQREIYQAQADVLVASLGRLEDALGGTTFQGSASDGDGLMRSGTFALLGPVSVFASESDDIVGTIEQRVGSIEPAIVEFGNPQDAAAAQRVIMDRIGTFPVDPTLGNAHKIEATSETFLEHVQKGGPVMYPIFGMAGAAFLVALYKWIALSLIRRPSAKRVQALLAAVSKKDIKGARRAVSQMSGPAGQMLSLGVEHLGEPRELVEEVMYESALKTRMKLQRFLPFIAICAAAAPLLGLLGTVTGIIKTFKLITLFGSGDVKTLSGGISEALITTEFGLIVAIPSLLLHAFLSRKARGIVGQMETLAVSFINQVSKTGIGGQPTELQVSPAPSGDGDGDETQPRKPSEENPEVAAHVREALVEVLASAMNPSNANGASTSTAPAIAQSVSSRTSDK